MTKKYILVSLILFLVTMLVSGLLIKNKVENVKSNKENIIYWVVGKANSFENDGYDKVMKEFNNELKKDGYNFKLKIVELTNPWQGTYREELMDYLNSGKSADIITLLFTSDDYLKGYDAEFIANGNFISFDNFDEKDVNTFLKKGTDLEWNSVKYNGKIYTIPSSYFRDYPSAYYFNADKTKDIPKRLDNNKIEEIAKIGGFIFNPIDSLDELNHLVPLAYINSAIFADGESGQINSLYNQKSFIDMIHLYNTLYKNGYINTVSDIDVSKLDKDDSSIYKQLSKEAELRLYNAPTSSSPALFYLLDKYKNYSIKIDSVYEKSNQDANYIELPRYIGSKINGSVGISSKSKNSNDAFKLLYLVNTNKKYSDILLYGIEGVDYKKDKDLSESDSLKLSTRQMNFEIFYNKSLIKNPKPDFLSDEDQYKLNSTAKQSPYIGFNFKQDGYEDIINKVTDIAMKNLDIWKSDNLDAELERVRKELSDAGIDKLTEEVKRQVEEWKHVTNK